MADILDQVVKFVNSFKAMPPEDTKCTVAELVRRGTSMVRVGGEYYEVTAKKVEITK